MFVKAMTPSALTSCRNFVERTVGLEPMSRTKANLLAGLTTGVTVMLKGCLGRTSVDAHEWRRFFPLQGFFRMVIENPFLAPLISQ